MSRNNSFYEPSRMKSKSKAIIFRLGISPDANSLLRDVKGRISEILRITRRQKDGFSECMLEGWIREKM